MLTHPHDTSAFESPDRLVVAPATGTFTPASDLDGVGEPIQRGDAVGYIEAGDGHVAVTSPFSGTFRGLLATDDERVREFEPVLWLTTDRVAS